MTVYRGREVRINLEGFVQVEKTKKFTCVHSGSTICFSHFQVTWWEIMGTKYMSYPFLRVPVYQINIQHSISSKYFIVLFLKLFIFTFFLDFFLCGPYEILQRGAWWATVNGVSKSWTGLSTRVCVHTHTYTRTHILSLY